MSHQVRPRRAGLDPFHPCSVLCASGIGLSAAMLMTRSHPLTGFVFGGVYHLVSNWVDDTLSCFGEGETAKTARVVFGILAGIAVAGALLAVFVEMSIEAACALTLAMVVARFAAPLFCCTSCCASGCALLTGTLPAG